MAPVVTGDINVDALDDLVRLCVELDARRRDGVRDAAWAALEQAVIGKAVDLVSGPGGLASFLRRRELGVRLGGPSLPLDIGYAETVPAGIRNAVLLRDRHCQWAGGCTQPAGACQVHHTRHKAHGGTTSVKDCVLALSVPPPDRHPPLGLDPGRQPGRDDHRLEQGQDQGPPQPRASGPAGVALPPEARSRRGLPTCAPPSATPSTGPACWDRQSRRCEGVQPASRGTALQAHRRRAPRAHLRQAGHLLARPARQRAQSDGAVPRAAAASARAAWALTRRPIHQNSTPTTMKHSTGVSSVHR